MGSVEEEGRLQMARKVRDGVVQSGCGVIVETDGVVWRQQVGRYDV